MEYQRKLHYKNRNGCSAYLAIVCVALVRISCGQEQVCTLEGALAMLKQVELQVVPFYDQVQVMLMTVTRELDIEFVRNNVEPINTTTTPHGLLSLEVLRHGIATGYAADNSSTRTSEIYAWPSLVNDTEDVTVFDPSCPRLSEWQAWCTENYPSSTMCISCAMACYLDDFARLTYPLSSIGNAFSTLGSSWGFMGVSLSTAAAGRIYFPGFETFSYMNMPAVEVMLMSNPGTVTQPIPYIDGEVLWVPPMYDGSGQLTTALTYALSTKIGNDTVVASLGVPMLQTVNMLNSLSPTPSGFCMIVAANGQIVTAPPRALIMLFGTNVSVSTTTINLADAINCNMSGVLSKFSIEDGYDIVEISGVRWIFGYRPIQTPPMVVCIMTPESEVVNAAEVTVYPERISLEGNVGDVVRFTVSLKNSGHIPLKLDVTSSDSTIMFTGTTTDILLDVGENKTVSCSYKVTALPTLFSLGISANDAVTAYGLCYHYSFGVSVGIEEPTKRSKLPEILGGTLGAVVVVLVVVSVILLAVALAYRKKALKPTPIDVPLDVVSTPAALAIEQLKEIKKRKKITSTDRDNLEHLIDLIQKGRLNRADYLDRRHAGDVDKEVDRFVMNNLFDQTITRTDSVKSIDVVLQMVGNGPKIDHSTWDFNAFICTSTLTEFALGVMQEHGLWDKYIKDTKAFSDWLVGIEERYKSNPYHNATHAMDVLYSVSMLIKWYGRMSDIQKLALVTAALCHDVGHPGRNNNFQCMTFSDISVTYNGISVLENMHASETFRLLREHNWLSYMNKAEFMEFYRTVTQLIISTDMSKHVEIMSAFNLVTQNIKAEDQSNAGTTDGDVILSVASSHKVVIPTDKDTEILILKAFIKFADISNPTKRWDIYDKWVRAITTEFFEQGDEEYKNGFPVSAFMDRKVQNVPKCQITFAELFVLPFAEQLARIVPEVGGVCVRNIKDNIEILKSMAPANFVV